MKIDPVLSAKAYDPQRVYQAIQNKKPIFKIIRQTNEIKIFAKLRYLKLSIHFGL